MGGRCVEDAQGDAVVGEGVDGFENGRSFGRSFRTREFPKPVGTFADLLSEQHGVFGEDPKGIFNEGYGLFFGAFNGKPFWIGRLAFGANGTVLTARSFWGTDKSSEFHEGARERSPAFSGLRKQGFCGLGEGIQSGWGVDGVLKIGETCEHSSDVGVDGWDWEVEGEGGDGPCGVMADAGQFLEVERIAGDVSLEVGENFACGGVEVSGSGVISESLPKF